MALAGDIRDFPFSDVAQLCSQIKCTGMLVLSSPRGEDIGFFGFESGELYDARLEDVEGLEAFFRALTLKEAAFRVDFNVRSPERRIFVSVGAMIIEGLRRVDEARRMEADLASTRPTTIEVAAVTEAADDHQPRGAEMNGLEPKLWICPICSRRFDRAGTCPDDRVELALNTATPLAVLPSPLLPPRGVPGMRRLNRALVPVAAGVVVVGIAGWVVVKQQAVPRKDRAAVTTAGLAPSLSAASPAASSPPAPPAGDPAVTPKVRGVSDSEIVFGMAAPFTGPAKELGRQMKQGIETAFNAANAAGGVNGRRLRLVTIDDGYEPSRTVGAMTELYDRQHVFGVVGNVGTPTAAMSLPFALERRMLFYGAFTGAGLLRRDPPDRYVFNFRASYAEETAAVVNYLVKVRRVRPDHIAVFAQEDAFGDAGFAGVSKALRTLRADGKIQRVGYKRNTIDVNDAVTRLRERGGAVRAVVMVATYRPAAKFIEKMRDINPKMIFTNVSFVGSSALAEELNMLGPKYASGVIVTQVVPPIEGHSTAILKYGADLAKYFPGEKTDYVSSEGYWEASVLIEGLRRAGPDLDTERVVDALEAMHDLDLGIGTTIRFGAGEHQGSHKVWGTELDASGHYQVVDLD
jgi:ABC-type branched-subunit amino acid transport system substrate-binding protein